MLPVSRRGLGRRIRKSWGRNETISMSDDYFRENILNGMMEDRKSFIPIAENATGLLKRAMYSFVVSTLLE